MNRFCVGLRSGRSGLGNCIVNFYLSRRPPYSQKIFQPTNHNNSGVARNSPNTTEISFAKAQHGIAYLRLNRRLKVPIPSPFPLTYQAPDIHRFYYDYGIKKAKDSSFTDTGFSDRDGGLGVMVNTKEVRSAHAMTHMFRRGRVGPASMAACVYREILSDHSAWFAAYVEEFEEMSTKWGKEIVGYTGKRTLLEKWKWLPKTVSSARVCSSFELLICSHRSSPSFMPSSLTCH